ncbi:TMV resistance protein N [Quillaja saponaria]|uniref:TMV resistance protein N n=1 Tax=Quillaja saponaria TaxID=32244 RepID=A0AAD7M5M7_QUISA|nr:TMV resistance protein N [Quillaja saponaria]
MLLQLPNEEKVYWNGEAFRKMTNLRILIVENAHFSQSPNHLPNSLRVLDWKNYPSPFLPPDFDPKNLVVLNLHDSRFELDKSFDYKKYKCLMYMDLTHCVSLEEVPDISEIANLVEFYLDHCQNLVKVHDSVGLLDKLVKISAKHCDNLNTFITKIESTSLQYLNLRGCGKLTRFPAFSDKMEKIRFIDVGATAIKELPSSFENLVGIEALHIGKCRKLRVLPSGFLMFQNLKELNMGFCPKLQTSFGKLRDDNQVEPSITLQLVSLNVQFCDLSDEDVFMILSCFSKLKELIPIRATHCPKLTTQSSNLLLNQGLNEIHNLTVTVDGGDIPLWFDHHKKGGSLSFHVRKKFPVIALGSVLGATCEIFQVQISLFINEIEVYVFEASLWTKGEDTTWLHDIRAHISIQQWEKLNTYLINKEWNLVQVSFTLSTGVTKWCGVHAYKQEPSKVIVTQISMKGGVLVDKKTKTPLLKGAKSKMLAKGEGDTNKEHY